MVKNKNKFNKLINWDLTWSVYGNCFIADEMKLLMTTLSFMFTSKFRFGHCTINDELYRQVGPTKKCSCSAAVSFILFKVWEQELEPFIRYSNRWKCELISVKMWQFLHWKSENRTSVRSLVLSVSISRLLFIFPPGQFHTPMVQPFCWARLWRQQHKSTLLSLL